MNLLCFDISSGGISAVLFDSNLNSSQLIEVPWNPEAALAVDTISQSFKHAIRSLNLQTAPAIDAICIGTFMHSCTLLDESDQPLTPVFTWLGDDDESGLQYIRSRIGDRFHERTGCRYHPMFPIFKLAAIRLNEPELFGRTKRVVSLKSLLVHWLTGSWMEDHGTASASGLFSVREGGWDSELMDLLGITQDHFPTIASRTEIVGRVTPSAAALFDLKAGVPIVAGSGDGFLANIGSGCEEPSKIAVTLGTSGVARQTLKQPVLEASAGTFCYMADKDAFLLGCAGSNGGNVLDWGRRIFGALKDIEVSENPPIFIPLLHGERSPDWNPHLTGSWHGLSSQHQAADLSRSILEGVIFNLAHFVEIVQKTSGKRATDLVLSGNGFLQPMSAPILAAVTGISTWMPARSGMASLRGAGICALRALAAPTPELQLNRILPPSDSKTVERYRRYRTLRAQLPS